MKRILILSGGGMRGLIPAVVLENIRKETGKHASEIFDLCISTSAGGLISGSLFTGSHESDIVKLFVEEGEKIFDSSIFRMYPKYKRSVVESILEKRTNVFGRSFGDCSIPNVMTSVNARTSRNRAFISDLDRDRDHDLIDIMNCTYAAPYYFGRYEMDGEYWLDGGTGSQNTPVSTAIQEIAIRGWLATDDVSILSIGTGFCPEFISNKNWRNLPLISEARAYLNLDDGGMAREQSRQDNIDIGEAIADGMPNITFQHVDMSIPDKYDVLDGAKYIKNYYSFGQSISDRVNYGFLDL